MTSRKDWIQTRSGMQFFPADPRPEDIRLTDIAWHLSMLCRYTGAVKRHYSVLEHSIYVSKLALSQVGMASDRVKDLVELLGLLHDAPEAYINDLNRPLKHGPGLQGYRVIEEKLMQCIGNAFGADRGILAGHGWKLVIQMDGVMLAPERKALMGPPPVRWSTDTPFSIPFSIRWKPAFYLRWYYKRRVRQLVKNLNFSHYQKVLD